MIDSITLKNFQIHKNTVLNLHPKINVIIGDSNQGKSSIIRGVKWFADNRPTGNEFIRDNAKLCEVILNVDGNEASRIRNEKGTTNKYVLNGEEYTALRTDVPEEIRTFLNVTDTNFQFQEDAPFLLSLNPGEVARKLNATVGLDLIDSSLQYVNSIIKKETQAEKYLAKEIKQKKKELLKFRNFDSILERYNKYEENCSFLKELDQNAIKIEKTISVLQYMLDRLNVQSSINELVQSCKNIDNLIIELRDLKKEQNRINYFISKISAADETIQRNTKVYDPAKKLMDIVQNKVTSKKELVTKQQLIVKRIREIDSQKKAITQLRSEYNAAVVEFDEFKSELEICPLCESVLGTNQII